MPRAARLALVVLLCAVAYGPLVSIPLIEDDYPNLAQALVYGPPSGLHALAGDAVFRLRATSYWLMYGAWQTFHLAPIAYHAISLLLHIGCALLMYAILRSLPATRSTALWAAAFFAVAEGHQEAVMWFSAVNELLMFLFGMAALLAWVRVEGNDALLDVRFRAATVSERLGWRLASLLLFALALISKESAVVLLPLLMLVTPPDWRRAARLIPYALLAAVAIWSVSSARSYSFRFADGSFSLAAPFWITWPKNIGRMLWIWGWLAVALVVWRARLARLPAALSLAWIATALLPYSFLTYSTQIPSRQTYLASAGLAVLVGLGAEALGSRRLTASVLAAIVAVNLGILWTRKRAQFLERAAPTEQLIRLARETQGPIWVQCFPRNRLIADEAVHIGAGRTPSMLVWDEAEAARVKPAATFCYGSGVTVKSSK